MELHAIEVVGAVSVPVRTVTVSTVLTATDYLVVVNNLAVNVTMTLPDAATIRGRVLIIHRDTLSLGTITVDSLGGLVQASAGTFGATTTIPTTAGQRAAHFYSDGTRWLRVPAA